MFDPVGYFRTEELKKQVDELATLVEKNNRVAAMRYKELEARVEELESALALRDEQDMYCS